MKTLAIDTSSLINFIHHDLLLNRMVDEVITADMNLITSGIIDSLSLIQLVTYLEKQTGMEIHDIDVNPDNFQSVTSIVQYLHQRMSD